MAQELTTAVAGSPSLTIAVVHGRTGLHYRCRSRIRSVSCGRRAFPTVDPTNDARLHYPREIIDAVETAGRVVIEQHKIFPCARAGSLQVLNARATTVGLES